MTTAIETAAAPKSVSEIIAAFGGLQNFSKETGLVYATAQSMKQRDQIDQKHWKLISAHAARLGIEGITIYALCDVAMTKYPEPKMPRKRAPSKVAA